MEIRIPYNFVNIVITEISALNCYGLPVFSLVSLLNIIRMVVYAFLFVLFNPDIFQLGLWHKYIFQCHYFQKIQFWQLHNMIFVGTIIYDFSMLGGLLGAQSVKPSAQVVIPGSWDPALYRASAQQGAYSSLCSSCLLVISHTLSQIQQKPFCVGLFCCLCFAVTIRRIYFCINLYHFILLLRIKVQKQN